MRHKIELRNLGVNLSNFFIGMSTYILNVSNALSLPLKADYVAWIKGLAEDINAEGVMVDRVQCAEMTQVTPDGDVMVIVQMYMTEDVKESEVNELQNMVVRLTHERFAQKVLAFGSVMRII